MPELAIAAALASAFIHACWNALLKSSGDRLLDAALVAFGWFVLGGVLILACGFPPPAAWPYVVATASIHAVYWAALSKGYDAGDLSHVYTLSRGLAPLLVAVGAAFAAAEVPRLPEAVGIATVCAGVLCVGANRHAPLRATAWALLIALCIGSYSLVDALGARITGSAVTYTGWMLFAASLPIGLFALVRRGPARLCRQALSDGRRGLAAGIVSGVGYGIVLFAQTLAPVAQVTALRETSVVFGALIAWLFLRERLGPRRWAGAVLVAAGAVVIALA